MGFLGRDPEIRPGFQHATVQFEGAALRPPVLEVHVEASEHRRKSTQRIARPVFQDAAFGQRLSNLFSQALAHTLENDLPDLCE
jgi:hypothetical protein